MATTPSTETTLPRSLWIVLVVLGVLTIAGGILALVYPDVTVSVLAIIIGISLLIYSGIDLVEAFMVDSDTSTKVLQVLVSIIGIIAGVICLRRPIDALLFIVVVAAIWLIIAGIVMLVRAFATQGNRGLRAIAGFAVLAVGLVLISWPDIGVGTLAILVGIGLIIRGAYAIAAGMTIKRLVEA